MEKLLKNNMKTITLKTANNDQAQQLKKLSTEKLIIWIVGMSNELSERLSVEDIVIECWQINPAKHSLRGYTQHPDSQSVIKRLYEMKGKKGLLKGSEMGGFNLTEISKTIFADLKELIRFDRLADHSGHIVADRNISSIDEAPYKRLIKSSAYLKFTTGKKNEIVETDFLYFYGISWHSKPSFIMNRIKNIDAVVRSFTKKDSFLADVHSLLNNKFKHIKDSLTNRK